MDIPEFSTFYDWLRSAEQIANMRRRRKPSPVASLDEVIAEPHRFIVVEYYHPEHLIVEPPHIVDLALGEAIAFRKTRGMGGARLNKMSWHGVKFLQAKSKRSRKLLATLASGRRLTGIMIA
jgi:hypothetical protein